MVVSHLHSIQQRLVAHEIGYPPLIRTLGSIPFSLDKIEVPRCSIIALGGDRVVFAADGSGDAGDRHQAGHLIAPDVVASAFHRPPELASAVDTPIGDEHSVDGVRGVGVGQLRFGDPSAGLGFVVGGRGDADAVLGEHGTDRVDPEPLPVSVDVVDDHRSRRSTSAAAKNALAVFNISLAWQERDLAIVFTALLTGCRLSELVVMNVGDLRDVDATGRTKAITVRGKGNKERVLTAEAALVDVLTDYLESRLSRFPDSSKARSSPTDSPWRRLRAKDALFVGTDGERITGPTIQYRVERAYRRAGINGQRAKGALVHQLRHTFATSLADENVSVYTLMRLLGHEAMTTTQRYTKGAGKETRTASALNPAYRMLASKSGPTEG